MYAPHPDDEFQLLKPFTRVEAMVLAAFLIIAGLAGSVGESAFQLRQAVEQQRERNRPGETG
jgi:hypothetical protein